MLTIQACSDPLAGESKAQPLLPLCSVSFLLHHWISPLSSRFYQDTSQSSKEREYAASCYQGSRKAEDEALPHDSNSGETTWQEAALEVSDDGILCPHPAPSPVHCVLLFAQGLGPCQKDSRPFHWLMLKISSRMSWRNEAVKDTEETVLSGVKSHCYVVSPAINTDKLFGALVAQWLSLSANFSHWHITYAISILSFL